jgi:hypothetical protein
LVPMTQFGAYWTHQGIVHVWGHRYGRKIEMTRLALVVGARGIAGSATISSVAGGWSAGLRRPGR